MIIVLTLTHTKQIPLSFTRHLKGCPGPKDDSYLTHSDAICSEHHK